MSFVKHEINQAIGKVKAAIGEKHLLYYKIAS